MIQSVDEGVGKILQALDELKIADRTVVIFTSDNGGLSVREGPNTPSTSNSPLRAGKGYLYEGGIRVPLIIAGPGVNRTGSVCDVPVSGQDLYPTILAMAGVSPAPAQVIDGESLVPLLKGDGIAAAGCPLLALPALQQPGRKARWSDPPGRPEADRMVRGRERWSCTT